MRKLARELLDYLAHSHDEDTNGPAHSDTGRAATTIREARAALLERKAAEDAQLLRAAVESGREWGSSYSSEPAGVIRNTSPASLRSIARSMCERTRPRMIATGPPHSCTTWRRSPPRPMHA